VVGADRRVAGFFAGVAVLRAAGAGFAADAFGFGLRVAGVAFFADAVGPAADWAAFALEAGFRADVDVFRFVVDDLAAVVVIAAAFVADFTAGFAAVALSVAGRFEAAGRRVAAGFRAIEGFRAPLPRSGPPIGPTLTGETASTAWAAAAPTSLAAPPTLSPTVPAALPAAAAARLASLPAIAATSWAASPACFVRFATSFRPFDPWAAASCARRFVSVALAAARRLSSFWSSFSARFDAGFTAPLAPPTSWVIASTRASLARSPFPGPALGMHGLQLCGA
jgi:hypothetical protein